MVLVVSEMVVDKVHKVEEVVTKEWKNWNLYSFLVQTQWPCSTVPLAMFLHMCIQF